MRVIIQNLNLQKYKEELKELCHMEKNSIPLHLWLVIDFKMKWEAMYLKETTVQNYGKQGISWHGNHAHAYIWDEKTQQPVKIVIKLDQILDGWNKQDGMMVLALVEAAQVFLHWEFHKANIEFLQSDNAGCHISLERVCAWCSSSQCCKYGISFRHDAFRLLVSCALYLLFLSQRMCKIGGPKIKNIIGTETQDGKSLLDAHFAHATALVKHWLRRKKRNVQKEASSPKTLMDALSNKGDLQNCGVQRDNFNSDVKKSLEKLAEMLNPVSIQLKEYFSCCNEINYFF